MKALVTGAEEHQGLAVIRGLGQAGIPVVACGAARRSIGFYSRHVVERAVYTSPFVSQQRFLEDVLTVVERARPTVVIPAVESTLVVLSQPAARARLERYAVLAAPQPATLAFALDKGRTLELARQLRVPVPRTVRGDTKEEILAGAADLAFPVAIKPRGNGLYAATANALGFKVRYAATRTELAQLLSGCRRDARALLVQEYVAGVGRCVAAVCRHGEPVALFAYAREREFPLSGGVSVVRRSVPLEEPVAGYVTRLLEAIGWHGVAMVEFKYDRRAREYTLMEINGRFQASTALSLDAGLNLPHLVASLYAGDRLPSVRPYRVGVTERWLRGDLFNLRDALRPNGSAPDGLFAQRRSRVRALWDFVRGFRPGTRYDEFRLTDVGPGLVEGGKLLAMVGGWVIEWVAGRFRRPGRYAAWRAMLPASTRAHRSIRA